MLVTSESVSKGTLAEQFDAFSAGYLASAGVLCQRLVDHPEEQSWPRAAACMFQMRLAVELFLKSAILQRSGDDTPGTHDLSQLKRRYDELYPASAHRFNVPFTTQMVGETDPVKAEKTIRQHDRANPMDQRFRYPVDREFEPWPGIDGCDPDTLLPTIRRLRDDLARLRSAIFG